MQTEELNYYLPTDLIAQRPVENRSGSRLLVLDRSNGRLTDTHFSRIGRLLRPADCLVLNDTKVIPARFFARRPTGAKIEGLFLAEKGPSVWEVLLKNARRVRPGQTIYLTERLSKDFCPAEATSRLENGRWLLKIKHPACAEAILSKIGLAPLPPYIKRTDETSLEMMDKRRYQTVYATHPGAVAAPTAGLHFTNKLITELSDMGIYFAYLTLHVGTGTFKPITTETLEQHRIHSERYSLDEKNAELINAARQKGGRIIAVGTTSVRTLETLTENGRLRPACGQTELFIKPGYEFQIIDAMITNFHLPKTSLLALVAAFASLENILSAYRHAIEQRYRFYSYGDVMLII